MMKKFIDKFQHSIQVILIAEKMLPNLQFWRVLHDPTFYPNRLSHRCNLTVNFSPNREKTSFMPIQNSKKCSMPHIKQYSNAKQLLSSIFAREIVREQVEFAGSGPDFFMIQSI